VNLEGQSGENNIYMVNICATGHVYRIWDKKPNPNKKSDLDSGRRTVGLRELNDLDSILSGRLVKSNTFRVE
jgi:hypothetical protein